MRMCKMIEGEQNLSDNIKMSNVEWDKKWHSMMDHHRTKKEQTAMLYEKMKEKQEMEECIECTFNPKSFTKSLVSSNEFNEELFLPLIKERENIMKQLSKIDSDEKKLIFELSQKIYNAINSCPLEKYNEELTKVCEYYRDERLKDISQIKGLRLDIVGLIHELERKFNLLCCKISITPDEANSMGFNIDECKRIKGEILESIGGYDSLKDRSKITREIERILKSIDVNRGNLYRGAKLVPKSTATSTNEPNVGRMMNVPSFDGGWTNGMPSSDVWNSSNMPWTSGNLGWTSGNVKTGVPPHGFNRQVPFYPNQRQFTAQQPLVYRYPSFHTMNKRQMPIYYNGQVKQPFYVPVAPHGNMVNRNVNRR